MPAAPSGEVGEPNPRELAEPPSFGPASSVLAVARSPSVSEDAPLQAKASITMAQLMPVFALRIDTMRRPRGTDAPDLRAEPQRVAASKTTSHTHFNAASRRASGQPS